MSEAAWNVTCLLCGYQGDAHECGSSSCLGASCDYQHALRRRLAAAEDENAAFRRSWGVADGETVTDGSPYTLVVVTPGGQQKRMSMANPKRLAAAEESAKRQRKTARR